MTFFDESVSTAREILSAGAQKATETIEIQKIRVAIARKKSSINAALRNLGKAYYDSCKNDCSAASLCDSVVEDIDVKVADSEYGENIALFAVPKSLSDFDIESFKARLSSRLTGLEMPKIIIPLAALPRTDLGKVDKAALKAVL